MDCQDELKLARQALDASIEALSALQRLAAVQQRIISERLAIVAPVFVDELNAEAAVCVATIEQAGEKSAPYFDQVGLGRLSQFIPGSQTPQ